MAASTPAHDLDREAREIAERLLRDLPNHPKVTLIPREDFEVVARALLAAEQRAEEAERALREACLHQGLPVDAPPGRIAAHFKNNREFREGFAAIAPHEAAQEER